jgi:hypothetical protein
MFKKKNFKDLDLALKESQIKIKTIIIKGFIIFKFFFKLLDILEIKKN